MSKEFRELLAKLPSKARQQAKAAYRHFRRDPTYRGLHFKLIDAEERIYSVRVGLHYRALGFLDNDEMIWFWIGTHAEYDKLLSQALEAHWKHSLNEAAPFLG